MTVTSAGAPSASVPPGSPNDRRRARRSCASPARPGSARPARTSSSTSGSAVSRPMMPNAACSNSTSFSTGECGAWSVATASMVPSASASRSAATSARRAQRRVALGRRVVAGAGLVGQRQVVRRHLAGDGQPAPLGLAHQAHRIGAADVRDVVARAGQRAQLDVARDHRRLRRRRLGADPGPRRDDALVHRAARRQRQVLAVLDDRSARTCARTPSPGASARRSSPAGRRPTPRRSPPPSARPSRPASRPPGPWRSRPPDRRAPRRPRARAGRSARSPRACRWAGWCWASRTRR